MYVCGTSPFIFFHAFFNFETRIIQIFSYGPLKFELTKVLLLHGNVSRHVSMRTWDNYTLNYFMEQDG